ncbi:MAG: YfiR family protein [Vicinamibacterales bacterium]
MSGIRPLGQRLRIGAALATLVLLCASTSRGQDVTEVALKAAFIYNFAKFTEWPLEVLPSAASLTACVIGDAAVGDALQRAIKGRTVAGHSMSVSPVTADGSLQTCHLLYLSNLPAKQAAQIAAGLRGSSVLTISDIDEFARLGGIAQFFVENGKMRFSINLESAKRSRLQLSSKLLALAALVESADLSPAGTQD